MEGSSAERSTFGLRWGNTTATARYSRILQPKVFFRSLLSYSGYGHGIRMSNVYIHEGKQSAGNYLHSFARIRDWTAKIGIDAYPHRAHQIKAGLEAIYHTYRPNQIQTSYPLNPDTLRKANTPIHAMESAFYVEDEITLSKWLRMNLGIRGVAFQVQERSYTSLEPRTTFSLSLPRHFAFKGTYSRMQQFIHLLVSNSVGLPNDIWVPATGTVSPQRSQQIAFGITKTLPNQHLELSIEGYYKTLQSVIDYQTGVNYLSYRQSWENQIEKNGIGRAYGIELFVNKTKGRFTGWLSYTYAWNFRKFGTINQGAWYLAPYDRRHSAAITGNYTFTSKFNLSANWVYHSGQPTTVPIAVMENFENGGYDHLIYGERNNYRMPSYHRLDIAANLIHQSRRNRQITWSLGLYNAYSHKNPYYLDIDRDPIVDPTAGQYKKIGLNYKLLQKSIFPLLPFVSYAVKF